MEAGKWPRTVAGFEAWTLRASAIFSFLLGVEGLKRTFCKNGSVVGGSSSAGDDAGCSGQDWTGGIVFASISSIDSISTSNLWLRNAVHLYIHTKLPTLSQSIVSS
jgi:hypothetical protein